MNVMSSAGDGAEAKLFDLLYCPKNAEVRDDSAIALERVCTTRRCASTVYALAVYVCVCSCVSVCHRSEFYLNG